MQGADSVVSESAGRQLRTAARAHGLLLETSLGMGAAVTFVMALSAIVTWLIQNYVLVPLGIEYMQTIVFILVIAALVQMVEIVLKKVSPSLYQALGIFLPLITTNCAVLGVAILTFY